MNQRKTSNLSNFVYSSEFPFSGTDYIQIYFEISKIKEVLNLSLVDLHKKFLGNNLFVFEANIFGTFGNWEIFLFLSRTKAV